MDASAFDEFKFPGSNVMHTDVLIGERSAQSRRYRKAVHHDKGYTEKRVSEPNDEVAKARQLERLF